MVRLLPDTFCTVSCCWPGEEKGESGSAPPFLGGPCCAHAPVPNASVHAPRAGPAETLWKRLAGGKTPRVRDRTPQVSTPPAPHAALPRPPCPATCWSPSGAGKSLFSEYTVRFFKVFGLTLRGGEMTKEETKKKL